MFVFCHNVGLNSVAESRQPITKTTNKKALDETFMNIKYIIEVCLKDGKPKAIILFLDSNSNKKSGKKEKCRLRRFSIFSKLSINTKYKGNKL